MSMVLRFMVIVVDCFTSFALYSAPGPSVVIVLVLALVLA